MKDLSEAYTKILSEKKSAYSEYRKIRDEAQDLLIAERNIASLYDAEKWEEQEQKELEK